MWLKEYVMVAKAEADHKELVQLWAVGTQTCPETYAIPLSQQTNCNDADRNRRYAGKGEALAQKWRAVPGGETGG